MKIVLPTTMIIGFILSIGIDQASGVILIQPETPLMQAMWDKKDLELKRKNDEWYKERYDWYKRGRGRSNN